MSTKPATAILAALLVLFLAVVACASAATRPEAPTEAQQPSPLAPNPTGPASVPSTPALAPTAAPGLVPLSAFQQGVSYVSWRAGEYSSAESDKTLSQVIKPMGVTWIALVVTCYQEKHDSTEIQCKPDTATPTDADVAHVIRYAHSLGMRVLLKPHVDLSDDPDSWRGEIGFGSDESAWSAWFASYTMFITHYGALAQTEGADYFSVGTELVNTSGQIDRWRAVIKAVRDVYSGPLTYASNPGEEVTVQWWDAVDAIGIDAYYPLTDSNQPTLAQLKAAWATLAGQLGALAKKWDRSIIFTEGGYISTDGVNQAPGEWDLSKPVDLQEQADCYQALFETLHGEPWWHGAFWWAWTTNSNQGGPGDPEFTANNKPAENVIRAYYGAPPRPTPTATPALAEDASRQFVIFADVPGEGWQDLSWDYEADYGATETVHSGQAAIKVSLKPWGALSFAHGDIDTSLYYWLEFYINVGADTVRRIAVSMNNGSDTNLPPPVVLANPAYLEGGTLIANQWQRVRIPLLDLGANHLTAVRITLQDNTGNGQTDFFLDDIRLVGAIPSP